MSLLTPLDPIRAASLARRERQKAETRQAILDAARALFVQHGVAATTMRGIAAAIGYTPTAIYHHFRDKDALLLELCLTDFGTMARALHAIGTIADPSSGCGRWRTPTWASPWPTPSNTGCCS